MLSHQPFEFTLLALPLKGFILETKDSHRSYVCMHVCVHVIMY